MSLRTIELSRLVAVGLLSLVGACAQNPQQAQNPSQPVASNPPPVAPGPNAIWYTVNFDTNSFAINTDGQKVVSDVIAFLQSHPTSVATIIGRSDTVGSNDYNMRLSHRRADAVRDALVYSGKLSEDRVETRWTGESRQGVPTGDAIAAAANRVVDIAIH